MKSSVERLNPTKVKIVVEVSPEEFAPAVKAAYRDAARDVAVPGFRKGKVPARILDQRLGKFAVVDFAIERSMEGWINQLFKEHSLKPIGQAETDIDSRPAGLDDSQGVKFVVEVEVRPDVKLPDLTTLTVTVPTRQVSSEQVDEAIEDLRIRFATLVDVDRPASKGDFVSIDMTATSGGTELDSVSGLSYEVGSGDTMAGLDEAIDGLSAGETTTFEELVNHGAHAGSTALVEVTVRSVKERELPELDDDFAQLVSEFDTVAELRQEVEETLLNQMSRTQLNEAGRRLPGIIADAVDMPVPEGILADRRKYLVSDSTSDPERAKELEAMLVKDLRDEMAADLLAETLKIELTQQDLINQLLMAASQVGADPSEFVEQTERDGTIHVYARRAIRTRAIDTALLQVTAVDDDGTPVDLAAIFNEMQQDDDDSGVDDDWDDETDDD
ncbi:MAG: trigger factor [Bifidobacteriaceae bacterium]|nr:trigger factor [Bifidobacteriaceae bacterium]